MRKFKREADTRMRKTSSRNVQSQKPVKRIVFLHLFHDPVLDLQRKPAERHRRRDRRISEWGKTAIVSAMSVMHIQACDTRELQTLTGE